MPPQHLLDVSGLAALGDVELWLVAHHPVSVRYEHAIGTWPTSAATLEDLLALFPRLGDPADVLEAPEFPRVPVDNFVTFLADARRELTPQNFEVVDQLFHANVEAARRWFNTAKEDVSEESVFAYPTPAVAHLCHHRRGHGGDPCSPGGGLS